MSITTDAARARMRAAIYTAAAERVDCCRRCDHSKPVCDGLRCDVMKANVGAMGYCALWRPIRRVVALAMT